MTIHSLKTIFIAVAVSGSLLTMPYPATAEENEKKILYWVAPMDANYRRDKPGKSPMGMELVPVYAGAADDGPGITISPEVVQNLGVRTAKAERSRLFRGIDTVGYVNFDESKLTYIHMRTQGWIEKLYVESEGERVKKGDPLLDLYAPELVNAQEEYVQAMRSSSKVLLRASRERLTALGISDNQIRALQKTHQVKQTITIYAPQDGIVSSLMMREGGYIKPANRILTLADLSSVWVLAEVFERQVNWVKLNNSADIRLSYLPGKTWEGKVAYIYPSLDPKTRTLKVRLKFNNPDELLKPNMYANVKIYGGPKEDTIVIPLEALIRSGREDRVIIAKGKGRFEARKITAGIESGEWVEVLTGLDAGETVVTSGQFLIDSEANLKSSIARMSELPDTDITGTEQEKAVSATGVVQSLMLQHNMVTLEHSPIPELDWPGMIMDFTVAKNVKLDEFKKGDAVVFELIKKKDSYVITTMRKAN